ncbi:hypothetical protein MU545_19780, partial [Enterococcus faecium]|nr:hypothetical protein [Enterococcus faecium]
IIDEYKNITIEEHPELLYDTTSWNKLYSTSVIRENHITFPVNQTYEDVSFTIKSFLKSSGIDVITTTVYRWRWRDNTNASITQIKNEMPKYLDRLKSLEQVRSTLMDNNLWHGKLKNQLLFKLLDIDIPLFMD